MVHHQIHDDLQSFFMSPVKQFIKILHGSKLFHNSPIITDIIAIVIIGRLIDRRHPDHINPQLFQIIQTADNPLQIADSFPVAVHKASWINLIYNCFLPP